MQAHSSAFLVALTSIEIERKPIARLCKKHIYFQTSTLTTPAPPPPPPPNKKNPLNWIHDNKYNYVVFL